MKNKKQVEPHVSCLFSLLVMNCLTYVVTMEKGVSSPGREPANMWTSENGSSKGRKGGSPKGIVKNFSNP